ncbi:MAG: hypothetical protein ACLPR9_18615 [Acidimicrobiales bacterium]|jgi:hypothetical protein
MAGDTQPARRLHLVTSPNQSDGFMGVTDGSDPAPAATIPTPRSTSHRNHPSYIDVPTSS